MASNDALEFGTKLLVDYWDSKDVDAFVGCFTEDAVWTVNTSPPAQGIEAVKQVTEALMRLTKGSKHSELVGLVSNDGTTYTVYGKVSYEIEGYEGAVDCSFCDVITVKDGKVAECSTFMDTAPLNPSPDASSG
ncbi:expressed unknown protein [Seminavis robusta]|uniref:SnoaL-like domain-containing protein n=1 Tax=Seminavis robusta TaxID=568900 RepID=A0A9N8DYJ8_9STRA|nr:expressed unknown protein [Seminavis robusta]|eukprot:Sro471_g149690.1 n/a (134) ;mRNA; r:25544-25945